MKRKAASDIEDDTESKPKSKARLERGDEIEPKPKSKLRSKPLIDPELQSQIQQAIICFPKEIAALTTEYAIQRGVCPFGYKGHIRLTKYRDHVWCADCYGTNEYWKYWKLDKPLQNDKDEWIKWEPIECHRSSDYDTACAKSYDRCEECHGCEEHCGCTKCDRCGEWFDSLEWSCPSDDHRDCCNNCQSCCIHKCKDQECKKFGFCKHCETDIHCSKHCDCRVKNFH
jgi:hypothetical protein